MTGSSLFLLILRTLNLFQVFVMMKGIEIIVPSSDDADITKLFSLCSSLAQKSFLLSHVECKQHAKTSPQRLWTTS